MSPSDQILELFLRLSTARLALVSLFSLAAGSAVASADTLQLVSTGSTIVNNDYIYPYNFSVDGSSSLTSLMCMNYDREIVVGESWNVSIEAVPTDNSAQSTDYREAAYAYSQLGSYSPTVVQFVAWNIFDPSTPSTGLTTTQQQQVTALLASASSAAQNQAMIASGFFGGFSIYVPTSNETGWSNGIPQEFIGAAQTPEPASFVLLGSGLLGAAGAIRRRLSR